MRSRLPIFDNFINNFIYKGIVLLLLNCKERVYLVHSQIYLRLTLLWVLALEIETSTLTLGFFPDTDYEMTYETCIVSNRPKIISYSSMQTGSPWFDKESIGRQRMRNGEWRTKN